MLRLALGPAAIILAVTQGPRLAFAPLLLLGLLSDIFDGVLARRLGVARPWLRRFDSLTDILYYLCIFSAALLVARPVLERGVLAIVLLLGSEAVCLLAGWLRFGAMPSTHCYSAKVYGLALFLAFLAILVWEAGPWVLTVLTIIGVTANLEELAVLLLSREAPVDVPGIVTLLERRRSDMRSGSGCSS